MQKSSIKPKICEWRTKAHVPKNQFRRWRR